MENNKQKIDITKTGGSHDVIMPLLFGIIAVIIMAVVAHFMGN